jgi:hypothetical protein
LISPACESESRLLRRQESGPHEQRYPIGSCPQLEGTPWVLSRDFGLSRHFTTFFSRLFEEDDLSHRGMKSAAKKIFDREYSRVLSRNVEQHISENSIASIPAGASIPMPLLFILRSFLIWKNRFSSVGSFQPCCWNDVVSSVFWEAAQSSLICLEDLLSKTAPIISFLFPESIPLVYALIFACVNLTPRIPSLLVPNRPNRPFHSSIDLRSAVIFTYRRRYQIYKASFVRPLSARLYGTLILAILSRAVPDSFGHK